MDNSYRDRITMLDPSTVKSRVFIKNISNVSKIEIEDRFKVYGSITGIMLQKNYCFVQFEDDESAQEAIEKETGSSFQGKVIEVCPARMPLDKATLAAQKSQNQHQHRGNREGRDRSPLRHDDHDWRDEPRYSDYDYRSRAPPPRPAYRDDDYHGSHEMQTAPTMVSQDRTNDCEIIVHNKKQRQYAEMIERQLKSYGLSVDLLFPNESIPVTRVLATISSRGTLYAITVSPQNEERNSLTLNILHGSAEEHRNMPLDQAIKMIVMNFDSYMKGGGSKAGGGQLTSVPHGAAILVATNHPDSIQVMLTLLTQNRSLTVLQYDTLLRYLSQRREQQVKIELGDSHLAPPLPTVTVAETSVSSTSGNPAQDQLQRRVLEMLDRTLNRSSGPAPVPAPVPAPPSVDTSSSSGIMQDPKVQMALSSLFQGDLMKNIGKK